MRTWLFMWIGVAVSTFAHGSSDGLVEARLISSASSAAPGARITVGVQLLPSDGWKLYWINPGDSGLPPSVEWDLPEGVIAGAIQWPAPRRFIVEGLAVFGYAGEVILPVELSFTQDLSPTGNPLMIRARVDWLVCRDACVPGESHVSLQLRRSDRVIADAEGTRMIHNAAQLLPQPAPHDAASANIEGDGVRLTFQIPENQPQTKPDEVYFFPEDEAWMDASAPQPWTIRDKLWSGFAPRAANARLPERVRGVLRAGELAWRLDVPVISPGDPSTKQEGDP